MRDADGCLVGVGQGKNADTCRHITNMQTHIPLLFIPKKAHIVIIFIVKDLHLRKTYPRHVLVEGLGHPGSATVESAVFREPLFVQLLLPVAPQLTRIDIRLILPMGST